MGSQSHRRLVEHRGQSAPATDQDRSAGCGQTCDDAPPRRGGEKNVWSVVNVPTSVEEDRRQVHRELLFARRDRGRHTNRVKGLLAGQGVPLAKLREFPTHLRTVRLWDGTPLPPLLCARLEREWDTVQAYTTRIRALKQERRALLRVTDDPAIAQVRQLNQLRGIGIDSAWLYVMEFFAWRQFRNRRQVGGLAGLTDTHYQSGDLQHGQGISKAGTAGSARWRSTRRGPGCAFSPRASSLGGIKGGSARAAVACGNWDRRLGAKITDRVLAISRSGPPSGGRRAARLTRRGSVFRADW